METKRCQRCHKLLRSEARACSRCGSNDFTRVASSQGKPTVRLAPAPEAASALSNLPASPHHAGHYSGLHPEDQPYQSSFLPVLAPQAPAITPMWAEEPSSLAAPAIELRVAAYTPLPQPGQQRGARGYYPAVESYVTTAPDEAQGYATEASEASDLSEPSVPTAREPLPLSLAPLHTFHTVHRSPAPPMPLQRPRRRQSRATPILLALSCFLFLVATSILAFVLLSNKPAPVLTPQLSIEPAGSLRVHDIFILSGSKFPANAQVRFTRDTTTSIRNADGTLLTVTAFDTGYFSVQITIAPDWTLGDHLLSAIDQSGHTASITVTVTSTPPTPPHLQLGVNRLDLGANGAGTLSQTQITLKNTGGDQVNWQASSDSSWLSISPTSGAFAGSSEVQISVNRGSLAPGTYTGRISFAQQGDSQAMTLPVTMSVNPSSARLMLSSATLSFTGLAAQNPISQNIALQNTGGQSLDWTASASTTSGGNWLAVSATSGFLPAGGQGTVAVNVTTTGLSAGSYTGTLAFSYAGVNLTPVAVTLTVTPPPVPGLAVQTGSLNFNSIQGQNPPPQSFTITNTGTGTLNWGIIEDANATTYAPVSAARGTLPPGKSAIITVTPAVNLLSASVVAALITVVDTDANTTLKSQAVKVTFTIVNQAFIGLNENQMAFSHTSLITISSQVLILTNSGSAPLNWALTISNSSPIQWLSVDLSSDTLTPGTTDLINVTCDSSNLSVGTYTATVQIKDTDAGTPVTAQTVTVTLTVSP